ncbi:hypothetical protein TIFTF001_011629 [Ficus carica]|uniref:Uncharacterized protein n=1 Tax=Ficus carica TaxID=3494 RepID=A0AA88D0W6_FICCA|nr:hypothetical protein TIFTF001_011629 [Ficus carica]
MGGGEAGGGGPPGRVRGPGGRLGAGGRWWGVEGAGGGSPRERRRERKGIRRRPTGRPEVVRRRRGWVAYDGEEFGWK